MYVYNLNLCNIESCIRCINQFPWLNKTTAYWLIFDVCACRCCTSYLALWGSHVLGWGSDLFLKSRKHNNVIFIGAKNNNWLLFIACCCINVPYLGISTFNVWSSWRHEPSHLFHSQTTQEMSVYCDTYVRLWPPSVNYHKYAPFWKLARQVNCFRLQVIFLVNITV